METTDIDKLQYVTELPPIERSQRKPNRSHESRDRMLELALNIKMWHITERPQRLRWYIVREVDTNIQDRYELQNAKMFSSHWDRKLRGIDQRYKVAFRGTRVYLTYDWNDQIISRHAIKEIRTKGVKYGPG